MPPRKHAPKPVTDTSVQSVGKVLQTRPFQPDVNTAQRPLQCKDEPEALTGGFDLTKIQYDFSSPPPSTFGQPLQAKLTIGEPNDKYEQEADRVAHDVVQRIHASGRANDTQRSSEQPQTNSLMASPIHPSQQAAMRENKEWLQQKAKADMQRFAAGAGTAPIEIEQGINNARGGGQSLAPKLQAQMGQAMGADFSGVRVHTDTRADQLNRSVQARAFTTGQDLFFKRGEYQPGSQGGQELIAHELTHVVQQSGRDYSASANSKAQLSEDTIHQRGRQSPRMHLHQTVEQRIQKRGENPHAKEGSYEGWGLTAHHIIAHTKLVEAYGKLNNDQKQNLLRQVIPEKLTVSMMGNVKLPLDHVGQDNEQKELGIIRNLLVDPAFNGEIRGIRVQDIRESFFEWMGGNQYSGPNTSIRTEPSSSKDDIDTDGQFYTDANYDELKRLGDELYTELDLKAQSNPDKLYLILSRIAVEAKDVRPHDFDPEEWVEVGTMTKLQQMADSKLLNRKHILDYSFFKLNIPASVGAFPVPYERLAVMNPGLSEFKYDGVEAPGNVGDQKVYFSLNTAQGITKKTKVKESLRSIFTALQAKITWTEDGWKIGINDGLITPVPNNTEKGKINGYNGVFNVSSWKKEGVVITDDLDSMELTKETSGESLYSYLLKTQSPVSSYLPKPLYEYVIRKPEVIQAIKRIELNKEVLQKRLRGLQKQKTPKGTAKQQALVQRQIENKRKELEDLKITLEKLESTVK